MRTLSIQYQLPHPLHWLDSPPEKAYFNKVVKNALLSFWRKTLSKEAESLSSLKYLKPNYISLINCHPIFSTCGSSTLEVEKAIIQARLLSGRYQFERLQRHFTNSSNTLGLCSLSNCWNTEQSHDGDIENFLISCPSLSPQRAILEQHKENFCQEFPHFRELIQTCLSQNKVQFLLDCSVMGPVISEVQLSGFQTLRELFKLTRNYCFNLHKARSRLLQR